MFRRAPEHLFNVLFFKLIQGKTCSYIERDLELIIRRLEILEIEVCNILQNPGNIGNFSFPIFLDAWKYWKSDFSVFWDAWKYYPNPEPNPKPNPYPFLDPGRVIPGIAGGPGPGIAGGPGPGRRAHPETQTHWGGYAPPDPPSGFFGTGGVQRHIF